jgi:hypothetical protein
MGTKDAAELLPYTLTAAGRKQLAVERHECDRLILAIQKVLNTA